VRRHEVASHVVFYEQRDGGIRIIRVLHSSMLPENYI
jgi:plasmid stabilization system protein ParE